MFKVNNKDTRTTPLASDTFSDVGIACNFTKYITPTWRRSGVFIVNIEHNSHL